MNELRTLRMNTLQPVNTGVFDVPRASPRRFEYKLTPVRSPELDEAVEEILRGMQDSKDPLSSNDAITWLKWEWKHLTKPLTLQEKRSRFDHLVESVRGILRYEDRALVTLHEQLSYIRPDRHRDSPAIQTKNLEKLAQSTARYQSMVDGIALRAREWLAQESGDLYSNNDGNARKAESIQAPFGIERIATKLKEDYARTLYREHDVNMRLQKRYESPEKQTFLKSENRYAPDDVYQASREIRAHKLEAERNFKTAYTHKESARKLTTTSAYHLIKLLKATGVEEQSARELLLEIEKHGAKAIKTQSGVRGFFARAREGWSEGGFGKMFKNAFRPDVPSSDELTKAADAYRLHARELNHWQGESNKWQKAYQELL